MERSHRYPLNFSGSKFAAKKKMIRTRANKGQGMFPWLQQTFVGQEDYVTTPKNVCIGGYKWGGKWYLEKHGFRRILAGPQNLESSFDKSQSLVFAWFVFTFLTLSTFYQGVSAQNFNYNRISTSRLVSDFTIRHP